MLEKLKRMLKSSRMWAVVIGALVFYAKTKGYIGEPEVVLIETTLGGFIAVKTSQNFQK
jgi:hypothetical protein